MAVMDIHPDSMALLTGMLDEILAQQLVISNSDRTEMATAMARSMFMRGARVIQVRPGPDDAETLSGPGNEGSSGEAGTGPRPSLS